MNNQPMTEDHPPTAHDHPLDLTAIRARAEAATPGPWLRGYRWHVAGTGRGNGPDRCAYCSREGAELIWSGRLNINGRQMGAHVHRSSTPWHEMGIYSEVDPSSPTCVVVETDEYGGCTDADAEHIAGMDPSTTLALVAEVDRLRSLIADVRATVEEARQSSMRGEVWVVSELGFKVLAAIKAAAS